MLLFVSVVTVLELANSWSLPMERQSREQR